MQERYLKHIPHIFLVSEQEDGAVFSQGRLHFCHDGVDNRSLVTVGGLLAAIKHVRLTTKPQLEMFGCYKTTYLINDQDFAGGGGQDLTSTSL